MVEKAPLRPASTRPEYQTFHCDYSHRRGTPAGPVLPRKSPPSSACRSSITLHTCRATARLLSGRNDNDDTRHGLVLERSDQPRSPHSRQTLTPHSTPRPHQSAHPHAGSLTDERLRVLAAHDWAPPRIAALDANTIATTDAITRALLGESVRESLERRLATERPNGTYDDTRAGHGAFSRGVVEDYDHGNHHLARATIRVADPGLVICAGLSPLDVPDADAPIIDELARVSDPNLIASVLADAAPLDLDRYAPGEA